jgi:hypothetical protein
MEKELEKEVKAKKDLPITPEAQHKRLILQKLLTEMDPDSLTQIGTKKKGTRTQKI